MQSLLNRQNQLEQLYATHHQHLDFYTAITGTFKKVDKSFIIIGTNRYEVDSVIDAVGLCLKCMIALDKPCPPSSRQTWQFFQKLVFGLPISISFARVNTLIAKVQLKLTALKNKASAENSKAIGNRVLKSKKPKN